jgi:hypothetical protein
LSYPYDVDKIANFHADMANLLASIREKSRDDRIAFERAALPVRTIDSGLNPYFDYAAATSALSSEPNGGYDYDYTAFRADIDEVIERLERFADDTNVERFGEINEKMLAIKDILDEAQGADNGMEQVDDALTGWVGGAAVNFRDVVIYPFGRVLLRQANLAKEIATVALSYQAIVDHARADSLDLASQLDEKLDPASGGGGINLDAVLFAIGAVASGIALITGGPVSWPAVITWTAATASGINSIADEAAKGYALDGIAARAGGEPVEERRITGDVAGDFIPSAHDQIAKVWQAVREQDELVRDGLKADIAALQDDEQLTLRVTEPELVTADEYRDLGVRSEVHIEDIVELKKAGVAYLPAVAQQLHKAHQRVLSAKGAFESAFGDAPFVLYKRRFEEAVERLDTALTRCRDFLYESGQNLATIADDYAETDQAIQAELEKLIAEEGTPEGYRGDPADFTIQDLVDLHLEDFTQDVYRPDPTGYY